MCYLCRVSCNHGTLSRTRDDMTDAASTMSALTFHLLGQTRGLFEKPLTVYDRDGITPAVFGCPCKSTCPFMFTAVDGSFCELHCQLLHSDVDVTTFSAKCTIATIDKYLNAFTVNAPSELVGVCFQLVVRQAPTVVLTTPADAECEPDRPARLFAAFTIDVAPSGVLAQGKAILDYHRCWFEWGNCLAILIDARDTLERIKTQWPEVFETMFKPRGNMTDTRAYIKALYLESPPSAEKNILTIALRTLTASRKSALSTSKTANPSKLRDIAAAEGSMKGPESIPDSISLIREANLQFIKVLQALNTVDKAVRDAFTDAIGNGSIAEVEGAFNALLKQCRKPVETVPMLFQVSFTAPVYGTQYREPVKDALLMGEFTDHGASISFYSGIKHRLENKYVDGFPFQGFIADVNKSIQKSQQLLGNVQEITVDEYRMRQYVAIHRFNSSRQTPTKNARMYVKWTETGVL